MEKSNTEYGKFGGALKNITPKVTTVDEVYSEEEPFTETDAISRIGVKELMLQIQQLPMGYRIVFNLYVCDGLTHKEISELLNISENTSKSQLHKAKALLQKMITTTTK